MFIFSTSIARDMDISHVKTAEEAVISMIETIYDDYKLDEDVVYTSLSIQEYLQAYDERSSEANVDNVFQYDAMLKWIENEEK